MRYYVFAVLAIILYGVLTWLFHIPLNPNLSFFWLWVIATIVWLCGVVGCLYYAVKKKSLFDVYLSDKLYKAVCVSVIAIFAIFGIAVLVGSPIFSSGIYAKMLEVKEASFDDFADRLTVDSISLMDTESATLVGSRELGNLSNVVSQFDDDEYYQAIVNDSPQKIGPLRYTGFFSWLNNHRNGIPGYVSVDPIHQDADYHQLDEGMRYTPSACFNQDLTRHIWLAHPTYALGNSHFELDDEGHPFYVTQVLGFKTFFGAEYVSSVIVTDPVSGEMWEYSVDEVPSWLDVVYDGDLLDKMYDWRGSLSGGWLNSMFGRAGCSRTGGDYGYVMLDGEQWIYTGVTSMNGDASNIGFLLASEKTAEAYFIPMSSADEASAMRSAEGKVQQFGYKASFPSLVLIDGEPSYVMVLKDDAKLIRMYAFVNAESYNIVACEPTLEEAYKAYEMAMLNAGTISYVIERIPTTNDASTEDADALARFDFSTAVKTFSQVIVDGDTYVFFIGDDDKLYSLDFKVFPRECLTIATGQPLSGIAIQNGNVYEIQSLT